MLATAMPSFPRAPAGPAAPGTPARAEGGRGVGSGELSELRPLVKAVIGATLREPLGHPDVEDAAHETLRRAIEGRSRLRDGEPLRPWVLGIARHVALDVLRARRRARARDEDAHGGTNGEGAPRPAALDGVEDPAPGPEDRLATAERARKIERALGGLGEGPREALVLFHVEGLAYQEIARRLGVPLGTVATWIARGRRSLADAMKEES